MENSKIYVNVMAEFTKDGRLLPKSFMWKDGKPEGRRRRHTLYLYSRWAGEPPVL